MTLPDSNPSKRQVYETEQELAKRIEELEALLSEHHAVGAFDSALIGDECPVCARARELISDG